jgi:hypothetical protein
MILPALAPYSNTLSVCVTCVCHRHSKGIKSINSQSDGSGLTGSEKSRRPDSGMVIAGGDTR